MHLSVALETNLFRAVTFPVKLYTSFIVFGDLTSIIAFTLSGFASIPCWDTMNLKNFPKVIEKTHFSGFNFILYLRSMLKVLLDHPSGWLRPYFSLVYHLCTPPHFFRSGERTYGSPIFGRWLLRSSVQRV